MPDDPTQIQTPGQALAGQPPTPPQQVGNTPLAERLAQEPARLPPAQQQQQPSEQPTPQQAVAAKHHDLGKVTRFLFGASVDPNTGEPVKQQPGAIFRSLLCGALLGGAIGSEGHAGGGSVGGFLSGFGRGGNAVQQQIHQRRQEAEANQQKKQGLTLEQQRFDEEKMLHAAALEHWNMENLAHGREADFRDREQLVKENEQDENVQKWAIENGAFPAPNIPGNAVPGNSQDLMKLMIRDPNRFNPPSGMGRLIVKRYNFEDLNHDAKNGWTEKDGKPVDWNNHMTWTVMFAPSNPSDKTPISMSGADWHRLYGVNFPPGSDPEKMYNVKAVAPLISVATSNRKQTREDSNQSFKEKHYALSATVSAARTNVTQLNSEKRELLRQGYGEGDEEVQDIDDRIAAEQQREKDAIDEMHPRIRERVKAQTPAATAAGKPNDASDARQTFSVGAWKKANPKGDVGAARAEAKKRGYNVVN